MKVVNYRVFALFLLISSIFVQNAYCYTYKVKNSTEETISVTVKTTLKRKGQKQSERLKPDGYHEFKFQAPDCLDYVDISNADIIERFKPKSHLFYPLGCGDLQFRIEKLPIGEPYFDVHNWDITDQKGNFKLEYSRSIKKKK